MSVELEALMAIRVTGNKGRALIASGLGAARFEAALQGLVDADFVTLKPAGRLSLSGGGLARLSQLLAGERRELGSDDLPRLYEEFVTLDGQVKSIITDWQLKATGGASSSSRLARLDPVHVEALRLIDRMARDRPRLGNYTNRLQRALGAIRQGREEFVAGLKVDSYHLVWFELHEDLLQTIGRERPR